MSSFFTGEIITFLERRAGQTIDRIELYLFSFCHINISSLLNLASHVIQEGNIGVTSVPF